LNNRQPLTMGENDTNIWKFLADVRYLRMQINIKMRKEFKI